MERRELLTTLAAATVAAPGCLDAASSTDTPANDGSNPDDDGTSTPDDGSPEHGSTTAPGDATGTPSPPDGGTTDPSEPGTAGGDFLQEAFVVPELVTPNSPDSFGVYGERDEQYVVALLDAAEKPGPAVDDVVLAADGDSYAATTEVGYGNWRLFDHGGAYRGPDDPSGWVVVPLPKPVDLESATLTWPGGEHALGTDAIAELGRPPASFEVRALEAPESVTAGETVSAALTVENTGDVDGTFVFAVNRVGPDIAYAPETGVRLAVQAGETATWTYEEEIDVYDPIDDSRPMTLHVVHRDDRLSRDITVEPDGTATGSGTVTGTAAATDTRSETDRKSTGASGTPTRTVPDA